LLNSSIPMNLITPFAWQLKDNPSFITELLKNLAIEINRITPFAWQLKDNPSFITELLKNPAIEINRITPLAPTLLTNEMFLLSLIDHLSIERGVTPNNQKRFRLFANKLYTNHIMAHDTLKKFNKYKQKPSQQTKTFKDFLNYKIHDQPRWRCFFESHSKHYYATLLECIDKSVRSSHIQVI